MTDWSETTVAERLRQAIKAAGGAAAVQRATGISMLDLSGYEAGVGISLNEADLLADGCSVPLLWLANGEGEGERDIEIIRALHARRDRDAPPPDRRLSGALDRLLSLAVEGRDAEIGAWLRGYAAAVQGQDKR